MPITMGNVAYSLSPYYSNASESQCSQISAYIDLLTRWNRKISLTSLTDPNEILRFHVGESIFAIQLCDFSSGRLADVGSGAGFPGLALKILRPDLNVVLLEPNLKKCAFLAEVVRTLELKSVEILSKPFEQSAIEIDSLQFVTSRALAQSHRLISWSRSCLSENGSLILWLSAASSSGLRRNSAFEWERPIAIPGSQRRQILIGHK